MVWRGRAALWPRGRAKKTEFLYGTEKMKLVSCHIENFGCLSSYELTFADGLNPLYAVNGGGKSTLAAFIRAMFYGLPAARSGGRFNDRVHYAPFSGGAYGGSLTFEWKGDIWRVERFFDCSSGDDISLYRGGAPADIPTGGLGEAVFGLDGPSFSRTLFIADEPALSPTGGIAARLGDYAGQTSGASRADEAVAALERAAKRLKVRGGRGLIAELEAKASVLRSKIVDMRAVKEGLPAKYASLNAVNGAISLLRGEGEGRAEYGRLQAELSSLRARARAVKERCGGGSPTRAEARALTLAAGVEETGSLGAQRAKPGGAGIVSLVLSALLVAAGCALLAFNTFAGVAALAAGVLFAGATLGIMFAGRKKSARSVLAEADAVIKKYSLAPGDYASAAASLSRDIAELEGIEADISLAEERLARMAGEGVSSRAEGEDMGGLLRRAAAIERDISDDEAVCERLADAEAELENVVAELGRRNRQYTALTAAAMLIGRAGRRLGEERAAPVAEAFARYSQLLGCTLGGRVRMGGDLSVTFEGGGRVRPEGHLSRGQRAVISLCFRLAVADALFGADRPFVVLDDPFCELDSEHFARAAALLSELSRERQMVYLYCHPSRKI